jgi:hypothetical protein
MKNHHTWKFFRAGGFDQVRIDSGADLIALDQLDQKLWVALACPTTGLEFDSKTLALIDTDKDGRIRAPELIAATKWAGGLLKNPDDLLKSSPSLPLSAINDSTPEGQQLLASAKQILGTLKKAADVITIDDTSTVAEKFVETLLNGDGIVPADAATEDALKAVINDVIACLGAETDRSGKPGVSQAKADQFFAEAQAYADWWKKTESDSTVLPLGEATAAAAAAIKTVKAKVDDYFMRCRLAAFDPRSVGALNREEKEYVALGLKDLSNGTADVASFPLARVEAGRPLPLKEAANPAWSAALSALRSDAVVPLLGDKPSLTEADWAALQTRLAPYESWSAGKAGVAVEKLGLKRVREILSSKAKEKLTALIAEDKKLEPEFTAIASVEKLVRYHRDLYKLCHNFVSFRDFYSRKDKAIFQAGTLYLDQRSCDLCLTVEDAGKHGIMASLAGTYLAYCECTRKGSNEKLQILAAFTDGDSDNLMVGRNGLFYDRKGRDWDATITKIIDNPISIRQAFWAPYKKVARFINEQIAKRAATADAAMAGKLAEAAVKAGQKLEPGQLPPAPVAPPPPPKAPVDPGMIAALGVGAAGIGGMVGGIASGFLSMKGLMPLGILILILLISGPSMIMAWLKLRKRNLGPILDANGWAVNAKAKINVPFGRSLTQVAVLPPGAQRDLVDPYAEKKSPWPKLIVVAIILILAYMMLNSMGYIFEWTHGRLGTERPVKVEKAAPAPAPAADATAKPTETPK